MNQPTHRKLIVAPEVAAALPAAQLAELEAKVDNPIDCWCCGEPISGPSAEAVALTDGAFITAMPAHRSCIPSGVWPAPGLRRLLSALENHIEAPPSMDLALREREPRALLFLEPHLLLSDADEDPLEAYAKGLGLVPVSGEIEELVAPHTDQLIIQCSAQERPPELPPGILWLGDSPDSRGPIDHWLEGAGGRALVIVARGLGLGRKEPTIEEALRLRPAWGALASIDDSRWVTPSLDL